MPTIARSRKRHPPAGRVDWATVDATTDEDIARQIAEDPDLAPELTEEALDRAVIVAQDETPTPYRDRVRLPPDAGLLQPGSLAPESGVYQLVGPRGGRTGAERTIARGDPLPPTPKAGQRWRLVGKASA